MQKKLDRTLTMRKLEQMGSLAHQIQTRKSQRQAGLMPMTVVMVARTLM
jgi:hypothetical protein